MQATHVLRGAVGRPAPRRPRRLHGRRDRVHQPAAEAGPRAGQALQEDAAPRAHADTHGQRHLCMYVSGTPRL